jgi:hypothetical protein
MSSEPTPTSGPTGGTLASDVLLVDAHVHLYPCYDPATFFEGAAGNLARAARTLDLPASTPGCLMFTEVAGMDDFARFAGGERTVTGWSFEPTFESASLLARRAGGPCLVLISGRQIISAEGLEILALGCRSTIADGAPIREVIETIRQVDALPVVPWAFGKWWFGRGRVVRAIIDSSRPGEFFLGDNGGRPGALPTPALLRRGMARGITVLPGSDPLPIAAQAARAGGFGFVLRGPVSAGAPLASIRSWLHAHHGPLERYGRLESLWGFVRAQLTLRAERKS